MSETLPYPVLVATSDGGSAIELQLEGRTDEIAVVWEEPDEAFAARVAALWNATRDIPTETLSALADGELAALVRVAETALDLESSDEEGDRERQREHLRACFALDAIRNKKGVEGQ